MPCSSIRPVQQGWSSSRSWCEWGFMGSVWSWPFHVMRRFRFWWKISKGFILCLCVFLVVAACAFRGVETRLKYDASNDDTSNLLKNGNDAPSNIVDVKQPLIPKNARFFTGRELLSTLLSIEARQNSGVSSDMLVDGNKSKLMPEMNPVFRIPENSPMFPDGVRFNSCAIVASSGGLLDSNLGEFIDSHDAVVRFNDAPTTPSLAKDVGNKTTVRILNNHVLRGLDKYLEAFPWLFDSAEYVITWESCTVRGPFTECLNEPQHSGKKHQDQEALNGLRNFIKRQINHPDEEFALLNQDFAWNLQDLLQALAWTPIEPNPPSTGFTGFAIMLHFCNTLSLVEFVPSPRAKSKPCYYYNHAGTKSLKPSKANYYMAKNLDRRPCKHPKPGKGWHPRQQELLLMLRLAGIASNSLDFHPSYNGVLVVTTDDEKSKSET